MECPVCKKEMEMEDQDWAGSTLCEEYGKCEDEYHYYYYQYAWGNTEEVIGCFTINMSCGMDRRTIALVDQQRRSVLALEREAYLHRKEEANT